MELTRRQTIGAGLAALMVAGRAARSEETNGMAYETVGALKADLRSGRISALDLADHAIARIEALDGKLNAVVVRDFDRARAAARAADAALARGEDKPLLGIPMTVKEAFNVAGLPTTWGIAGTEKNVVAYDAVAVTRLKQAGAVILGKTNVPTMLLDWQTSNPIHGTTNNPWDVARTPGGSSGGGAAALAAGLVPLEFGSDLAGSLRVPAHFCGVYAHKPTWGIVPMRGMFPPGVPDGPVVAPVDLAVAGPMARSAADLMLALDVTAGPDDLEATGYRLALPPARHARLGDFRVLVVDAHPLLPTEATITNAIAGFAERLEQAGCKVARGSAALPDLEKVGLAYTEHLMAFIGADMPADRYEEARRRAAEPAQGVGGIDAARRRGLTLSYRDWLQTDRLRAAMAGRWRALFRDWDVVLCPVMPTVAFPHDHRPMPARDILVDGVRVPYGHQSMWSSVATFTGQPATAMPIGFSADGLPIGVQVIGPYLEDRTTIAFAGLVEREFGGFVPPPALP